jgi:hypothetical protein
MNRGKAPVKAPVKGRKTERPGLTEDEIEEIREAFNLFDTEGTGKIDPRYDSTFMQRTQGSHAEFGLRSKEPYHLPHDC